MYQSPAVAILGKDSESPLHKVLIHTIPIPIYTCDDAGYITSFNKAAAELWGREPKVGQDRWCGSLKLYRRNGDPLPTESCPMARALKYSTNVHGEEIIIERPDGDRRNVVTYPVPVFNDAGKMTGVINTLVDITGQRLSETRQSVLAAIIDSSQDAIFSNTVEGIILSWNRAAERMFGYREEEVLGEHIGLLISDDLQHDEEAVMRRIQKGEWVNHYETVKRTREGRRISISLSTSPIMDRSGNIIGVSKIARDITPQKEYEITLRKNAENLETLNSIGKVISMDLDIGGILQKVIDTTTLLTGASLGTFFQNTSTPERGQMIISTYSKLIGESAAPETIGVLFGQTFSSISAVRTDDIRKICNLSFNLPETSGQIPIISYMSIPVISKSGAVIGGLFFGHTDAGHFTDEHEKLISGVAFQAAMALDNAKLFEEIRSLNARKDEFIGLASHELKTPVTTISGYMQILTRSIEDPLTKRFAEKALLQVNKLSSLVEDLLDVSRIQTGNLPLVLSRFDMTDLIDEVIEMEKYARTTHRIQLLTTGTHLSVVADRQRIEQVLLNLITNGMKYSPATDLVKIMLDSTDGKIRVAVQDFGIGIPKDQQEHIFDRFYRVESQAKHFSGLGMGLFISSEIIQRHQGRLWVESAPGNGSVFFFELPAAENSSEQLKD